MKKAIYLAKILAINILIFLFLFELTLRVFPEILPRRTTKNIVNPKNQWMLKANLKDAEYRSSCFSGVIETNELGLRSLPMSELLEKNQAWLFVGDSMVQALQVNNTSMFTSFVQKAYPEIAIFNISKSGAGFKFYNFMTHYYSISQIPHPNITKVFYFLFWGNDFSNLLSESDSKKDRESYGQFSSKFEKKYLIELRGRKSYFEKVLDSFVFRNLKLTQAIKLIVRLPLREKEELGSFVTSNGLFEKSLELLEQELDLYSKIAQQAKFEAYVVSLPSVFNFDQSNDARDFVNRRLSNTVKKKLDKFKKIHYLPLAEKIIERVDREKLDYPYLSFECDGHLSPKGHRVVYEELVELLKTKGF